MMERAKRLWAWLAAERDVGSRIVAFDVLRFVAFVFVVVQHAFAYLVPKFGLQSWMCGTRLGRLGVSFFIVLSGASLALGALNRKGYFAFVRRRLASILPFYWVAYCAVAVALFLLYGRCPMQDNPARIAYTLFGLDGYLGTQVRTYYLIGEWFTGFILLMYLLAPGVYRLVRWSRGAVLLALAFICGVSLAFTPEISAHCVLWNKSPHYNVLSRLMEFAAGMAFTLYALRRPRFHAALAVLAACYLGGRGLLGYDLLEFSVGGFASQMSIFLLALALLRLVPWAQTQQTVIGFLSKYSFMAFLFHHQVLWLMKEKMTLQCTPMFTVYMVLAACVVSYLLAYLFYGPAAALQKAVFGPFSTKESDVK